MIRLSNLYLPSRLFVIAGLDIMFAAAATILSLNLSSGQQGAHFTPIIVLTILLSAGTYVLCFYLFDLYEFDLFYTSRQTFMRGLRAVSCGVVVLLPVWWGGAFLGDGYRRAELYLIVFVALLCCYRGAAEWLHHNLFPKHRILLLGSGPSIQLLADAIAHKRSLSLRLRGIIASTGQEPLPSLSFATCGDLTNFAAIANSFHPDRVAVCSELHSASLPASDLLELRRMGTHIEDAISLYERITGRIPVKIIRTAQMTFGKGFAPSPGRVLISRVVSAIFASLALLLSMPIFLFLAALIKVDSKGPVFYKQERVGLNGKTFGTIKFRSMRTDAETGSGPVWASDHDPRVTRVGRILRNLRLDELPQLWNVLRGDMNLIGPRPERPHFVSVLKQHIPYYDLRHSIAPGITGWAQVCAGYGANIEESQQKLEYDLFYIKNRSLLLDAGIFIKTIKIMVSGKGAR